MLHLPSLPNQFQADAQPLPTHVAEQEIHAPPAEADKRWCSDAPPLDKRTRRSHEDEHLTLETTSAPWYLEGSAVFANDGEYVGVVNVPSLQGGALVIVQGWLFTQACYLPLQLVRGQDTTGVFLTISKAQVQQVQWKTPPTGESPDKGFSPPLDVYL
jgi:hypothetical protein